MDHINKHFQQIPRYVGLQKPLEAANVCQTARLLARGRFDVISFKSGLLTLSAASPSAANNLQLEIYQIQKELNLKLGQELVDKIRVKIETE